jgi:hypothetical protein
MRAFNTRLAVFPNALVAQIFCLGSDTQIGDSVIQSIQIDVVYLPGITSRQT